LWGGRCSLATELRFNDVQAAADSRGLEILPLSRRYLQILSILQTFILPAKLVFTN
jgi:hypothetical protein